MKAMYERHFKRIFDIACSLAALAAFWWLFLGIAIAVRVRLGSPVLFTQYRPGRVDAGTGRERIFKIYKFRTMTDGRDRDGNLLPDEERMTGLGRRLRELSLDELPEIFNILRGDMSIVGPRPQLVRDMVFMTDAQRGRHAVRPGLTGLAQVRGRNAMSWEGKMEADLEYVEKITLAGDLKIILATAGKVLAREGVTEEGKATSTDLGDYLLESGRVTREEYEKKQMEAREILENRNKGKGSRFRVGDGAATVRGRVSVITPAYNCSKYIGEAIESVLSQTYGNWEMIIVDDQSTDNTPDIVRKYAGRDGRIIFKRLRANSGAAVARTAAMRLASGQYMAFLDSDDAWLPDKLEKQLGFMRSHGYAFSCTSYEKVDEGGRPLNKIVRSIKKTDYDRLLLDCPVGNSTVMYDVSKMGKFRVPNIRKRNDDALWLQMLKEEKYIYGYPEVLTRYRVRGNSISSDKLSLVKYHWILYRKIEHLSIPRSLFHIGAWGFIKLMRIK